jgi:2-keto-3-deoxy-L-rhamnonate aldolase RhmA
MRENKTKRLLRQGQAVVGTWLDELKSSAVAQLLASAGMDFLIVDMEHGPYTLETMAEIVRVARLVDITPIVRIPFLTWEWVGRVLDAGAQGLMLPRAEDAAQLEAFVTALKYPPAGRRGMASGLGNTDFQPVTTADYINFINDEILVIAQIETKEAMDNLDAIVRAPGIDLFFIGPEDLSISLGFPSQYQHPQVVEAIGTILSALKQSTAYVGMHTSDVTTMPQLYAQGIRFISYASDVEFIYNSALQGVQAAHRSSGRTQ